MRRALLIPKTDDGRVVFAIPWLGRLLVGTTEQEVALDEDLAVTQAEAEYLLRHLNRYFSRTYSLNDVVAAFSGIRPLVRAGKVQTKKLVRDHEVEIDRQTGLVSLLGGKWTTYRHMAEDAIDAVQRRLGQAISPSRTREHLLAGATGYFPAYPEQLAKEYRLQESTALHLAWKFGTEAEQVLALGGEDPAWMSPVVKDAPAIQAEIVYAIRREMAVTVEDVLARRIGLQYFSWAMAIDAAPIVASHLARELRWSEGRRMKAGVEYVAGIRRLHIAIGKAPVPGV